ncbi:hypothetical protein KY284_020147 [Solanum tuberosum]|nr:hypothetical protein KY284_020147 [Solanum tuberosum]
MQTSLPIPLNSSLGGRMPDIKQTSQALQFRIVHNVISSLTTALGYRYTILASHPLTPGDSPNTDGIHLQNSKDVLIRSSNVSCGN